MFTFAWVIIFILILLTCITVHEFGHFLAAVSTGVKVHEFAIGFGPKLYSFKVKRILFSIRALPLGGYVLPAMRGVTEEVFPEDPVPEGKYLEDKKWYFRVMFILTGITFNLLFALLLSLIYLIIRDPSTYGDFLNSAFIGIAKAIGRIFTGDFAGTQSIPKEISSLPDSNWGIIIYSLIISININLGMFNVLPIPPLDGWRLVELTYEKITRKPISTNVKMMTSVAGIIVLLTFSVLIIVRDYT